MTVTITITGTKRNVEQVIADILSNIQYDNSPVVVKVVKK